MNASADVPLFDERIYFLPIAMCMLDKNDACIWIVNVVFFDDGNFERAV
jgi:hypothetical protein